MYPFYAIQTMPQSTSEYSVVLLQECLILASDISQHLEANQAFTELQNHLASDNPLAAALLNVLWHEMMAAQRSANFWKQVCNVERNLMEQITESHFQLQRSYLRLVAEQ
jgi:hypothetical protein